MKTDSFDVFVIGGGGTGSEIVHGIASQGGMRVGLAERDRLGGECNWYGCVPSKIMLRSAKIASLARSADRYGVRVPSVEIDFDAVRSRVRRIVERNVSAGTRPFTDLGAQVVMEEVRILSSTQLTTSAGDRIVADRIVFASGTEALIPPIDGLSDGPYWTNKDAIWHAGGIPHSLLVIGGGPIGVEFAQIYSRFGSRVTVVESLGQILPAEDEDSALAIRLILEAEGITIMTNATITSARYLQGCWSIEMNGLPSIDVEAVLVATGRRPVFEGHDLAAAGVELNNDGTPVLSGTLRTTAPNIWAAGDATGELLFTHVGSYEAGLVVDSILGKPRMRDYRVVPKVTYCDPEVASVGMSETDALDAGYEVVTSLVKLEDNERAVMEGSPEGHVKLLANARTGELIGGHIVASNAGEMIHEVVLAMASRMPVHIGAAAIHAYPTVSQSVCSAFNDLVKQLPS
ncbi:MAG TPA: FAD-dependent oxidoreductase [Acidimicrobiales bacterium]|nr:FAD-dependent oxidoreductase [Acidimicrobiales bacterium]